MCNVHTSEPKALAREREREIAVKYAYCTHGYVIQTHNGLND